MKMTLTVAMNLIIAMAERRCDDDDDDEAKADDERLRKLYGNAVALIT